MVSTVLQSGNLFLFSGFLRLVELDGDDCQCQVDEEERTHEDDEDEEQGEDEVHGLHHVHHDLAPAFQRGDHVDHQETAEDVVEVHRAELRILVVLGTVELGVVGARDVERRRT